MIDSIIELPAGILVHRNTRTYCGRIDKECIKMLQIGIALMYRTV
jgi:hypothetical protein